MCEQSLLVRLAVALAFLPFSIFNLPFLASHIPPHHNPPQAAQPPRKAMTVLLCSTPASQYPQSPILPPTTIHRLPTGRDAGLDRKVRARDRTRRRETQTVTDSRRKRQRHALAPPLYFFFNYSCAFSVDSAVMEGASETGQHS